MSDRPSDKRVTSTQESLQPQRIGKEEKAYQSVLDIEERLQKGDATNIALTGPYGSTGKITFYVPNAPKTAIFAMAQSIPCRSFCR